MMRVHEREPPAGHREGQQAMAVSEETLPRDRSLHVSRRARLFVGFVIAVALGAGAVLAAAFALHESLVGRILPGVTADGLDLGGMTPDAARAALADRYRGLTSGGVTIRSDLG